MKTPGDVTKLPKWAQQRISMLERDNQALRDERRGNWSDGGETEVLILHYPESIPLPQGSRIHFQLKEGGIQVSVRGDGDHIEVYGMAGGRLSVMPSSSNVVRIKVVDY